MHARDRVKQLAARGKTPGDLHARLCDVATAVEILAGGLKDVPAEQTKQQASPHETHIGLIESNDGKTAVCVDGGRFDGWILYKHVDGQWVSLRKATPSELDEARALWANKVTPPTSPPTPQPSLIERLKRAYVFAEMEAIAGGGDPVDMGVRAILATLGAVNTNMPTLNEIQEAISNPVSYQVVSVWDLFAPILAAKDARIQELESLHAGSMHSLRKQLEFAPQDGDATTGKWILRADVLNAIDAQVSAANVVAGERLETIELQRKRTVELERQLATARADIEAHITRARCAAVNLGHPDKTLEDAVRAAEQQRILDGIAAKKAERGQRADVEPDWIVERVRSAIKSSYDDLELIKGPSLAVSFRDMAECAIAELRRIDKEREPLTVDGKTPGEFGYDVWYRLCRRGLTMALRDWKTDVSARDKQIWETTCGAVLRAFGNQGRQTPTTNAVDALQMVMSRWDEQMLGMSNQGTFTPGQRNSFTITLRHIVDDVRASLSEAKSAGKAPTCFLCDKGPHDHTMMILESLQDVRACVQRNAHDHGEVLAFIDDKLARLEGAKSAPTNEFPTFVASKDVVRGSYFCTGFWFRPYLHVGRDIEFDDIPRLLNLGRNDVIEIRVVQRAKQ